VGVSLSRSIEGKLTHFAEVAYISGATKGQFLRKILLPLLRKDFFALFLFVFSVCFSSFSVPLIVGGGKGTTIEVLIYEKIRLSMEWGSAVILSSIQLVVLAGLSVILLKSQRSTYSTKSEMAWYGHFSGAVVLGLFTVLYFWGYVGSVMSGFSSLIQFNELHIAIFNSTLGTLYVGFATGLIIFGMLGIIAFTQSLPYMRFFLRSYVAPSTTLTGFAFLVFGPNEGIFSYIKIPFALCMLFAGPLFRMGWENEIDKVKGQMLVAETLGAQPIMAFRKIVWPQIRERASLLAGIAAAWACGDYALTRILAYKDMTLGLMTETLMSTYRLNMASVLSFGILICSLLCFIFFWSFQYVYRRKSL
jgi:thiamine transport system permease protein